jgi:hypothetical protein
VWVGALHVQVFRVRRKQQTFTSAERDGSGILGSCISTLRLRCLQLQEQNPQQPVDVLANKGTRHRMRVAAKHTRQPNKTVTGTGSAAPDIDA